ncbi:hypothetical protein JJE66_29295 [Bradyrhizobium diazoefficiens]|uniref:hypothetical protein n=1 Tax=Bradyrhizobium diazoefficiens TaxID=1355477 RepID=UPI00190BBED9|nr:hypothetical protein [Bradyrhizobium diazoefficiens]MBK3665315.1 hypothetical protein [Bradyrhizobium diazoefficiens]
MSTSIELIVAGYVKVKNRKALEQLRVHRRKLLNELKEVTGINPINAVQTVQDELLVIEAGLEELKPPPGSLPDNNWD